eukprot:702074_1
MLEFQQKNVGIPTRKMLEKTLESRDFAGKSHIPCHACAQETPDECSEAGREKITLKPVESIPLTPEALQKKRQREILDKLVRFEPDVSKRPVPILTQLFPTGTSITLRPILPSITTSASESAWGRHISTLWTLSWRISRRTDNVC